MRLIFVALLVSFGISMIGCGEAAKDKCGNFCTMLADCEPAEDADQCKAHCEDYFDGASDKCDELFVDMAECVDATSCDDVSPDCDDESNAFIADCGGYFE